MKKYCAVFASRLEKFGFLIADLGFGAGFDFGFRNNKFAKPTMPFTEVSKEEI